LVEANTEILLDVAPRGVSGELARFPQKTKSKAKPVPGPKGDRGPAGVRGLDGMDGVDGKPGKRGVAGAQGPQGEPGEDGLNIYLDKGAPPDDLGVDGESYINGTNGDLYARADGGWTKVGSLKGKDGKRGAMGEPGAPGPRGRRGIDGVGGADGSRIYIGEGDPNDF
jgi:hypothetical protein